MAEPTRRSMSGSAQPREGSQTEGTTAASTAEAPPAITGPEAVTETPPAPTPGPRAARLQQLYALQLNHTLAKLTWENWATCFPTVARRAERVLVQLQEKMVSTLQEKCEREFNNILTKRQVVAKLNELEALVGDAAQRREETQAAGTTELPTPPHTLPPATILAGHTHPVLARHQSGLRALLQQTQAQNTLLADDVRRQRAEVEELLGRLEDAAADVRGANEALAGVVEELAEETRMDAEYV